MGGNEGSDAERAGGNRHRPKQRRVASRQRSNLRVVVDVEDVKHLHDALVIEVLVDLNLSQGVSRKKTRTRNFRKTATLSAGELQIGCLLDVIVFLVLGPGWIELMDFAGDVPVLLQIKALGGEMKKGKLY